ncbi:hypothetical protein GCM10009117_23490 [Gangjinia marincola]|uniref:Sec-independent protein translocase protein TatA n=1 Tax=Gangjinia marincola TaxID=578463 RepID=A0ABP3XXU2_9FLAO
MNLIPFFISGGEIVFVLFIVVMVFGADKIPEIARGLGKGMKTLRNATDDIKSEISKSAEKHGIDKDLMNAQKDVESSMGSVQDDIEEVMGAIKRKR